MKRYTEFMDGITASETLRGKLRNLEKPKMHPRIWQKYGAMAAVLVLVLGLGVWSLSRWDGTELGNEYSDPTIAESGESLTAPAPGPIPDSPGMETMGGYEVQVDAGGVGVLAYYMLPYIEYGEVEQAMQVDIALPVGVTRRDLTPEEIEALFGGAFNLTEHLNWDDYTLYAHAMVWPDHSMWLLCVAGIKGDTGLEHFSLEVSPGRLPPSCLYYEKGTLNNIWERDVWAESYDSLQGSSRRVSFMDRDYGYRFEISGFKAGEISELVSRLVRWVIAGDGLLLDQNQDVPHGEIFPGSGGEVTTGGYDPAPTDPPPEP